MTVVIMYIMNYLDRNNIAAARIAGPNGDGLQDELGMTDTQWCKALLISSHTHRMLNQSKESSLSNVLLHLLVTESKNVRRRQETMEESREACRAVQIFERMASDE